MSSLEKFNNSVSCLHTYLMFVVSLSLPYLLTEMTEEEQFALALKMSEQEAR